MYESNKIDFTRRAFGDDFSFGAATSAYQIEGAWNAGGKGMSNWDYFTQMNPDGIADRSTGCDAVNHYNMFKDDVALMKKMGFDSYRFSIAWTRILPGGRLCAGLCNEGIKFYNDLIDELVEAGIKPYVTLFHWDVPQCLEEEYDGFLSDKIVKDFCEYAEVCFWNFGDRVKRWITLNEPWSFASQGYAIGNFPPCRGATIKNSSETTKKSMTAEKSIPIIKTLLRHRTTFSIKNQSTEGHPGTEPYIVAHNLILSHAHAVRLYNKKYKVPQNGQIGMTNVAIWYEPLKLPEDVEAASRALDFNFGWGIFENAKRKVVYLCGTKKKGKRVYLCGTEGVLIIPSFSFLLSFKFVEPLVTGQYPKTMKQYVGDRLPTFTAKEEKLVKGSYDFLGINYYTSCYAADVDPKSGSNNYLTDSYVETSYEKESNQIGELCPGTNWLYIYPKGIYKLLMKISRTYGPEQVIYITENGATEPNDSSISMTDCISDYIRSNYHRDHLENIKRAMNDGVKVKGYFIWSLLDNFEWASGYNVRFGIFYVDFANGNFTRYPKNSAICWKNFLANHPDPWFQPDEGEKTPEN